MSTELGHFALCLAFVLALVQGVLPLAAGPLGRPEWRSVAVPAAQAQFVLLALSFAALTAAFLASDYSVRLVVAHSHSAKPWLYKLTGVWGNHEGSMLLWALILALFGAIAATAHQSLRQSFRAHVLGVQGLIGAAFLAFILFTSNPFMRMDPAPLEGQDLNPLLQDPGLAFHPPFLYLGYVGFSITFAFAVAALIEGRVDGTWARALRPWALGAWMALTLGIALGSWWAYYELGGGGWWFWDPVENASLMPWLLGTALLHSVIVVEKRGALRQWTVLLAILTFVMSLLGTFLVRAGVLTSVHAFANDPERGVFILMILVAVTGAALALYAVRARSLAGGGAFAPVSREGALILNNLILVTVCATVLIGTLYPLFLDALGAGAISVGPPYFNMTVVPLMLPLLAVLPVGAMLAWKKADAGAVLSRLYAAVGAAVLTIVLVLAFTGGGPVLAALGMGLAAWLVVGAFADVAERAGLWRRPVDWAHGFRAFGRALRLPRAVWGQALAHAGLGIMVAGIVGVTAYETELIKRMSPGESMAVGPYSLRFDQVREADGSNYRATQGVFHLQRDGETVAVLTPERRFYPAARQPTTEVGIYTTGFGDIYVALGESQAAQTGSGTAWTVRAWEKPLIPWIWGGALVMVFGGGLALVARRPAVRMQMAEAAQTEPAGRLGPERTA